MEEQNKEYVERLNKQPNKYDNVEREILSSNYSSEINSELFRLKLLTEETIQDIENNLRGLDWDGQRGQWIQTREPLLNNEGINAIMTNIVKPVVNKEVLQSNLDEEYIQRMAIQFEDNLADTLFANFSKFGLKSKQNMNNIVDWVGNIVYCTLRRAYAGGERKSMSSHEVREVLSSQPQRNKGIIGGFFNK